MSTWYYLLPLLCSSLTLPLSEPSTNTLDSLLTRGSCWQNALSNISQDCRNMNEHSQAQLAFRLMNCHLVNSGEQSVSCESLDMHECGNKIGMKGWIAYTEFYTHAFHICSYLHNKEWQAQTEDLVFKLTRTSTEALSVLSSAVEYSKKIKRDQEVLNSKLEDTLEYNEQIQATITHNREEMSKFAEEFKFSTSVMHEEILSNHRIVSGWFQQVFNALSYLSVMEEYIADEVMDFKTMLFYIGFLVVSYVITNCKETRPVRAQLWMIMISSLLLEKWVVYNELTLRKITRLTAVGLSIIIVFNCFRNYQNYQRLNCELLVRLLSKLKSKTIEIFTPRTSELVRGLNLGPKKLLRSSKATVFPRLHMIQEVDSRFEEPSARRRRFSSCDDLARTFQTIRERSLDKY